MGKGGRCARLTTLPPSCAVVMKSGNLNFLEPSGPLQACKGTDLPFYRSGLKRDKRGIHPTGICTYVEHFAVMLCLGNLNVGNYVIKMQWLEGRAQLFPTNTTVRQNNERLCCDLMIQATRLYLRYS